MRRTEEVFHAAAARLGVVVMALWAFSGVALVLASVDSTCFQAALSLYSNRVPEPCLKALSVTSLPWARHFSDSIRHCGSSCTLQQCVLWWHLIHKQSFHSFNNTAHPFQAPARKKDQVRQEEGKSIKRPSNLSNAEKQRNQHFSGR